METSSQLIFQIDSFIPKRKTLSFENLLIKFSEKTSLQSVPLKESEFWLKDFTILKHPTGALATIVALVYTRPGWSTAEVSEKLLRHIFNIARNHNFQGGWDDVGKLLHYNDLYTFGIRGILAEIVKNLSKEDFFGNFLPIVYSIVESNLCYKRMYPEYNWELSQRERRRGLKRKIRRRGYNDKGSLKPNTESSSEIRKDVWLQEKELQRKEVLNKYQLKDPLSYKRYWYKSLHGDGSNDSINKRKEISHGRQEIQT
jgi:hypothetical protein